MLPLVHDFEPLTLAALHVGFPYLSPSVAEEVFRTWHTRFKRQSARFYRMQLEWIERAHQHAFVRRIGSPVDFADLQGDPAWDFFLEEQGYPAVVA